MKKKLIAAASAAVWLAVFADGTYVAKFDLATNNPEQWVNTGIVLAGDATTNFTFEAWVKPLAVGTSAIVSQMAGSDGRFSLRLVKSGDDFVPCMWMGHSAGHIQAYGTTSLALETWYHIAGVRNGTVWKLYVNGELDSTFGGEPRYMTPVPAGSSVGLSICIGNNSQELHNSSCRACISDVRIWSYPRTAEQIRENYRSRLKKPSMEPGLVGYFPLAGTEDSVVYNYADTPPAFSGGLHYRAISANVSNVDWEEDPALPITGELPSATSILRSVYDHNRQDLTRNAINTGKKDAPSAYTLMGWFRTDQSNGDNCFFSKIDSGNGRFQLYERGNKICAWYGGDNSVAAQNAYSADGAWSHGQWHHLAYVYDPVGQTSSIYIDGTLSGGPTDNMTLPLLSSPNWCLCGTYTAGSSKPYGGLARALSIWSRAFSADEVAEWRTKEASGGERDLIGAWPMTETEGAYCTNVLDDTACTYADSSATGLCRMVTCSAPALVQMETPHVIRFNRAFFGTNAVDTGISTAPASFTWMGWVRLADNSGSGGNSDQCVVAKFGNGNGRMQAFVRGPLRAWFGNGTGLPAEEVTGETTIPVNEWTHLAIVKTPTTLRLYVNGALDGEKTNMTLNLLAAPNWMFGGYVASTGNYKCFKGQMCNVSLWSRAFGTEKIAAWKNAVPRGTERGLIGAWMFDDGPGDVAANAVAGASDATPVAGSFLWRRSQTPEWTDPPSDSGLTVIFK